MLHTQNFRSNIPYQVSNPSSAYETGRSGLADGETKVLVHSTDEAVYRCKSNKFTHLVNEESLLFSNRVEQWHRERGATSSLTVMTACPAYLKIIGMGEKVLPLILNRLRSEGDDPDHWFAALEAITGEDPIPEQAYGDTVQMAQAWFQWAEENYVW